jgi:hypothetical protein
MAINAVALAGIVGFTAVELDFLSHLRSLGATMSQKSSVPQAASFVSWALKRDTA